MVVGYLPHDEDLVDRPVASHLTLEGTHGVQPEGRKRPVVAYISRFHVQQCTVTDHIWLRGTMGSKILREIREDLNKLLHDIMELESYMREVEAGKVSVPEDFPQRTHTGTWRGRIPKLPASGEGG